MAYLLVAYVCTLTFVILVTDTTVTLVTAFTVSGIVVILATDVKRLAYNLQIRENFKSCG